MFTVGAHDSMASNANIEIGVAVIFDAYVIVNGLTIDSGAYRYYVTGAGSTPKAVGEDIHGTVRTEVSRTGDKIYFAVSDSSASADFVDTFYLPKIDFNVLGTRQPFLSVLEVKDTNGNIDQFTSTTVPPTHDAITPDIDINIYQADGLTKGASGPNIEIKLKNASNLPDVRRGKQGEVYRAGVVFQDAYGRESEALWVCDIKIPYYTKQISLLGKVTNMPPDAISARFVYVERTMSNRSILAQGIVQTTMAYMSDGGTVLGHTPFPYIKRITRTNTGNTPQESAFDVDKSYEDNEDFKLGTNMSSIQQFSGALMCVSPETILYKYDFPATKLHMIGALPIQKTTSVLSILNIKHPSDSSKSGSVSVPDLSGNLKRELPAVFPGSGESGANAVSRCILDGWGDAEDERTVTAEYFFKTEDKRNISTTPNSGPTLDSCRFLDYDNSIVTNTSTINNHISYTKFNARNSSGDYTKFSNLHTEVASSYVCNLPSGVGANISLYCGNSATPYTSIKGYLPVGDLYRNIIVSQYGGQSFYNKSNNRYIVSSEVVGVGTETELFLDTYSGMYKIPYGTDARNYLQPWEHGIFSFMEVYLESTVKASEFNKKSPSGSRSSSLGTLLGVEVKQYNEYDDVFSQIPNATETSSLPFNFVEVTNYPTRIVPSDQKRSGEMTDAWTNIFTGTYMDLDTQYGPVNVLVRYKDDVLAFQDQAIALVDIFPRAQTSSSSGQISLGKGAVLDDYRYIKIDSGTIRATLIQVKGEQVFYIDTHNKTINELTLGDIGSVAGFNTLIKTNLNPRAQVILTDEADMWVFEDETTSSIHFKIAKGIPTLVYNIQGKEFTHRRTYAANYFIPFKDRVLGSIAGQVHLLNAGAIGTYFNVHKDAYLEYLIEPVPGVDKVFDAISIRKEGNTNLNSIRVSTENRTSGLVPAVFKSKFDIFSMHLPRVSGSRDRWRTRNLRVFLVYTQTEPLAIDSIVVKFSIKKM